MTKIENQERNWSNVNSCLNITIICLKFSLIRKINILWRLHNSEISPWMIFFLRVHPGERGWTLFLRFHPGEPGWNLIPLSSPWWTRMNFVPPSSPGWTRMNYSSAGLKFRRIVLVILCLDSWNSEWSDINLKNLRKENGTQKVGRQKPRRSIPLTPKKSIYRSSTSKTRQ